MVEEIWRPVVGFEGFYEVSSLGRVRNFKTGKILKQEFKHLQKGNYLRVQLSKHSTQKHYSVHRLVARAFPESCGEWFEGCQINHKNEDKTDNRAENLEVCTAKYNTNYGTAKERMIQKMTNHPSLSKSVIQYTLNMEVVAIFPSIGEAARQTGVLKTNISACCKGKYGFKSPGGFIWRYT